MIGSERVQQTVRYYDQNAETWANQRKKIGEPSFWDPEYAQFRQFKKPEGKVLEIGSGSGREALELVRMGYQYTGIDLSKELIKIAQETCPRGRFYYAEPSDLPFENETFDAFTSWALLTHCPKDRIDKVLSEIRRVLKANGAGFIAMREGTGESQESETGRWFSYYSLEEFENILKKNGFQILHMGKHPSRANLVWLTFILSRSIDESANPLSLPSVGNA